MTGQPTTPPPQSSHKALVRETNGYSLRLLICSVKTPCFVCSSWCCWLPGRCCCRGCQSSSMDAATWVAWSHNDGRLVWARHWVSWSHQWTSFLLEMNWFASPARNSFLEIPSVISEVKKSQLMSVISCNFCLKTIFEASIFFGGGQYDLFNQSPGLDLEDTSHPMVCKQRKAKVPIRGGHRLSCPLLYLTGWKLYTGQSCNAQLLETSSLRFWDSFKLLHTYKYVCRRQSGQVVVWKGGKPHNKNIQGSTWDEGGYRYTR